MITRPWKGQNNSGVLTQCDVNANKKKINTTISIKRSAVNSELIKTDKTVLQLWTNEAILKLKRKENAKQRKKRKYEWICCLFYEDADHVRD